MPTRPALDLAVDAERLAQLAAETGDYRLQRAAEALRELHRDDLHVGQVQSIALICLNS